MRGRRQARSCDTGGHRRSGQTNTSSNKTIQNTVRNGIGYAIRQGYKYALENRFELIVIMAGNGKDDPREIPRLTTPILKEGYDYVQGSRLLLGGSRKKKHFLTTIMTRHRPQV